MQALQPDFFLCSGDTIYAGGPLTSTVALPRGRTWHNVVTPRSRRCARRWTTSAVPSPATCSTTTCGRRRERAADPPVGRPRDPQQLVPRPDPRRQSLHRAPRRRAGGTGAPGVLRMASDRTERERRVRSHLPGASRSARCSTCSSSTCGPTKTPTGPRLRRPERRHARSGPAGMAQARAGPSKATWKVIANDLPLGLVVPDTPGTFAGVSQGDNGRRWGASASSSSTCASHTSARSAASPSSPPTCAHLGAPQDPAPAAIGDFTPFWEFVPPAQRGRLRPNALDTTFGPQTVFSAAPPVANTSPADAFSSSATS